MRVLMVRPGPGFSVADVHAGWLKAFRGLGCSVVDANLDDRLSFYSGTAGLSVADAVTLAWKGIQGVCYEFWPDVVVVTSGFFAELGALDIIRSRGTKVVMLHTESPYEDDLQLRRGAHADLNVLNDPTNLDRFAELGPAFYAPHAYDPEAHFPAPAPGPEWRSDFAFVGTGFPSRVGFLEGVDWSGIDVALAGNWGHLEPASVLRAFMAHEDDLCCGNDQTVALYRGTKASANLYRREAERPELAAGWAMGPREVELAACGTFFLTEARGENRTVLPMVPTFEGPGDFGDQLRWYLERPELRAEIARAARAAVAERTFTANARALLAALDSL